MEHVTEKKNQVKTESEFPLLEKQRLLDSDIALNNADNLFEFELPPDNDQ